MVVYNSGTSVSPSFPRLVIAKKVKENFFSSRRKLKYENAKM